MVADLLARKATHFVLWRPRRTAPPPRLVIGQLRHGNPPAFLEHGRFDLHTSGPHADLWEIAAADCDLQDGEVYHYWFEVTDSDPARAGDARILCTDPTAWTVDWRLLAPLLDNPYGEDDRDPPAVVKFKGGRLLAADPGGEEVDWGGDAALDSLPANNRLVIYELPTSWTRFEQLEAPVQLSVGTFRDILALIDADEPPGNFSGLEIMQSGRAHLIALGVNALELLPAADSFVDREWGYATSNYFAPDYDLGFPRRHLSPTAAYDLVRLIKACHQRGMRFFADFVMAFATRYSYHNINFADFHVQPGSNDPEEFNQGERRDGFGGDLFKYNLQTEGYDPLSGQRAALVPARALMRTHLERWMRDFRVDGIRLDSIVNIGNWDFVGEFKDHARAVWRERAARQGLAAEAADRRFLVVGEELAMPLGLVAQNRLDGLWNEHFKRMLRYVILGQNDEKEASFEWTVRKLIDCRILGFTDGSQAINYLTSHDVEGYRNERLFELLRVNGVGDIARRIKLAFVCLLTAVGVPMIFAGEEFADEHDLPVRHPQKQVDPVNFDRMSDPWRMELFGYVARLIGLRKQYDALALNDTDFIHVDFNEGKRVLVWQRGRPGAAAQVVVVANFSDYGTPDPAHPQAEYVVPNWPATPPGRQWREITQGRDIPPAWVGREPIYPWEAKVYVLI
jgi:1,4-alpha-glucan branching enzyme